MEFKLKIYGLYLFYFIPIRIWLFLRVDLSQKTYLPWNARQIYFPNKKEFIFRLQVIGSLVLGAFLVKQINDYAILFNDDTNLNFVTLLVIMYIVLLISTGFCIDLFFKLTHPQIAFINTLIENPELLGEESELKTSNLLNLDEFWQLVNMEDKPLSPDQYEINLRSISVELKKYHPIKMVEFYNRLDQIKKDLFSKELYQIYLYVWGRKYQENHYEQFIKFIIAQGKTEVGKIKNDQNDISSLDLNLIKLQNLSITAVFINMYIEATGRIFPIQEDLEMKAMASSDLNVKLVKENFPTIFQKFK